MGIKTSFLMVLVGMFAMGAIADRVVRACSPPPPVKPFGLPRPSSVQISTATSLYIVSEGRPAWVEVTAGSAPVKTDGVEPLGDVYLAGSRGQLWHVLGLDILQPSVEYVVSATVNGQKVELTRFSTAAGYDKQQGIAPLLRSVKFWRVHYPPKMIGGGSCVFAEYYGFIELDYEPATVPDTPSESVLYSVTVYPKTYGSQETLNFTGAALFKGRRPEPPDYFPGLPPWPNDLDPTREYCARLTARGYGDIARLPLNSQAVCSTVTSIEAGPQSDRSVARDDRGNIISSDLTKLDSTNIVGVQPRSGCSCRIAGEQNNLILVLFGLVALTITCRRRKNNVAKRDDLRRAG